MRKLAVLLLLSAFFFGCSDSKSDRPEMKIVGVYIAGDESEVNYADMFNRMPALTEGDEVSILFNLDGNGSDLRAFVLKNENSGIKATLLFEDNEMSDEFSSLEEGILAFSDGVNKTELTVKITINKVLTGEQFLSFYLFSKAADSTGANINLAFKTVSSR